MARPYFLNLTVKVMAGGSVDMLKDYVDCDHPLDGLHVRLHHNVDVTLLDRGYSKTFIEWGL